jgi:hypothetical protein
MRTREIRGGSVLCGLLHEGFASATGSNQRAGGGGYGLAGQISESGGQKGGAGAGVRFEGRRWPGACRRPFCLSLSVSLAADLSVFALAQVRVRVKSSKCLAGGRFLTSCRQT